MKTLYSLILVSLALLVGCDNRPSLHIFSWSDYYSPDVLRGFEDRYGCRVVVDTFDSNEAMYAKLKAGCAGYDIVTPTSYFVALLAKEGIIEKIDRSKVNNALLHFDMAYAKYVYDPDMSYSVPYAISYAGIMYLKDKVSAEEASSWSIFGNPKYNGKSSMLADVRDTIGIGLMYNGYSINTTSQSEIDKAVETISNWKKNIRKFDSESYKTEVAAMSSYFGHAFSSDAAQVIIGEEEGSERNDIAFSLPKEGFSVCCDEFAVISDSLNKDLAYKFIDYMYETEVATVNMEYICSLIPQDKAVTLVRPNLKSVIIPDAETMSRGQKIEAFDGNQSVNDMYNSAWDRILSTKEK